MPETPNMLDDSGDDSEDETLEAIHPDSVTVAIFCALSLETAAVRHCLDEALTCSSSLSGRQDYVYSFGRMAEHNIVIAQPSNMGPVNTAHCAATVSQQFTNVRFALMVGIGAGIPSEKRDIRLGDLAISYPQDGHPGVLEYDFGKYKANGEFSLKGTLNKPPKILIGAISSLEVDEIMGKNPIKKTLRSIMKNPSFRRPSSSDVLFDATFPHVQVGANCNACETSAKRKVVSRDNRMSPWPVTHRGLILSGGGVIKNPEDRVTLCRDKEDAAICFEMEAAGIMDQIPCLVVRGICDYADTHKQDAWHYYAAAVAAAYCKVALMRVPGEEVEKTETMKEISQRLNEVSTIVESIHTITRDSRANDHHDRIRSWLLAPDPSKNFNEARNNHHRGTCQWFLDSEAYTTWKRKEHSFLWLHGIPGCGKTILNSSIVADLAGDTSTFQGLAYFYFDFSNAAKRSVGNAVRSLITQLYDKGQNVVRTDVHTLYSLCNNGQQQPSDQQLSELLQSVIRSAGEVWIVLDALDECGAEKSVDFTRWLLLLKSLRYVAPLVHILATSRSEERIESSIKRWTSSNEIIALVNDNIAGDINHYIRERVLEIEDWKSRPHIQEDVEAELTKNANGMFRWVACQIDDLAECLDTESVYETLRSLPETLNDTYKRILQKLLAKHERHTIRLLQFLTYSERPLRLEEAVDAIAVKLSDRPRFSEARRVLVPEKVARYCSNLVTIVNVEDKCSGERWKEIQLAHFSVQQYLRSDLGSELPVICKSLHELTARATILEVCLAYLLDMDRSSDFHEAKQRYPFAKYSAWYWVRHAWIIERSTGVVPQSVQEYLLSDKGFAFGCVLLYVEGSAEFPPCFVQGPLDRLFYVSFTGPLRSSQLRIPTLAGRALWQYISHSNDFDIKQIWKIELIRDRGMPVDEEDEAHDVTFRRASMSYAMAIFRLFEIYTKTKKLGESPITPSSPDSQLQIQEWHHAVVQYIESKEYRSEENDFQLFKEVAGELEDGVLTFLVFLNTRWLSNQYNIFDISATFSWSINLSTE